MKKLLSAVLALCVVAAVSASMFAETSVQTINVNVTATVLSPNTVNYTIKNVTDNNTAASFGFGTLNGVQSNWGTLAKQYIEMNVLDNAGTWILRGYTDNFATNPSTTVWGTNYYGAMNQDNPPAGGGCKVYVGMSVSSYVVTGGMLPSVPDNGSMTSPWKVVADKHDSPFVPANGNLAVGGPSWCKIYPATTADGILLASSSSPMYWYVDADFSSAVADSYTAKFKLELLNQ